MDYPASLDVASIGWSDWIGIIGWNQSKQVAGAYRNMKIISLIKELEENSTKAKFFLDISLEFL